MGLIPGSGKSPGGGHDNPLQHSCLEDPMDRRPWWATVHGTTKSQTQLKQLITNTLVGRLNKIFIHLSADWWGCIPSLVIQPWSLQSLW